MVKKTTIRHVVGGLLVFSSMGALLVGAAILAASAFQKTGALSKAADAAAVVPGGQPVAAGLMVAHSRATRTGAQVRASQQPRATETVVERTPIEGEMGGTRTRTIRRAA